MKRSSVLALGGMITSLCTAFNILAAIIPAMGYIFPAFAGILILIVLFECGYNFAGIVYFSSSVLSLLLCVDKFPAIAFVSLLGFYPMLKLKIESLKMKFNIVKTFIKFLVLNISVIANLYLDIKVFGVPEESLYMFGVYVPYLFLAVANATFIIYDRSINNVVIIYLNIFQKRLRKIMNFRN